MKRAVHATLVLAVILVSGCAVRLGGGGPQQYEALALHAPAGASAADVAAQIRNAGGDLVLLSADRDSAWFAAVAAETNLALSGPGRTGPRGMAFLSSLEILGDTALTLELEDGGRIHMQDALLRVDRNRYADLMLVHFDTQDLRAAVQRLLLYFADDVIPDAPLLVAVDGPPAVADSVAVLMRVFVANVADCPDAAGVDAAAASPIRLLYGPSARISCRSARAVGGAASGVHARVVVSR